jgi:hypothetical protein
MHIQLLSYFPLPFENQNEKNISLGEICIRIYIQSHKTHTHAHTTSIIFSVTIRESERKKYFSSGNLYSYIYTKLTKPTHMHIQLLSYFPLPFENQNEKNISLGEICIRIYTKATKLTHMHIQLLSYFPLPFQNQNEKIFF